MKFPLFIIGLLFFVTVIFGTCSSQLFLKEYAINLSVELLGALITLLFIDLYIGNRENKIAMKREGIAWTLLKPVVTQHFDILFQIYKSSAPQKGINLNTAHLSIFFDETFLDNYRHFNVKNTAPVYPPQTWTNYLKNMFTKINNGYDNVLEKYAIHLDPELVKTIEDIRSSHFHKRMIESLTIIFNKPASAKGLFLVQTFGELFTKEAIILPYFDSMKELLMHARKTEVMDNFFSINDNSWDDRMLPKIASCRIVP
ncbi:MAG: hypothetical protein EOO13_09315 [Chitinophagaceae bacterium]|nr:MAG: hypothetical protein EOO13_09315 [Chitinophagaceae bacterium]